MQSSEFAPGGGLLGWGVVGRPCCSHGVVCCSRLILLLLAVLGLLVLLLGLLVLPLGLLVAPCLLIPLILVATLLGVELQVAVCGRLL